MKLLLLEDNVQLAESLGEYLEKKACSMDYAYKAATCIHLIKEQHYDVLIMDISMPGMSGLEACQIIRSDLQCNTPIIFLTARDTLEDKISGFQAGCDDYLVKPFSPEELLYRINALSLRGPRHDVGKYEIGDLQLDYANAQVTREGKLIKLHQKIKEVS